MVGMEIERKVSISAKWQPEFGVGVATTLLRTAPGMAQARLLLGLCFA